MATQIPDYFTGVVEHSKESFCDLLQNPALWSDTVVKKTLERMGGQAFNYEDVQDIIKDYLAVLSETIRKGEPL